MDSQPRRRCVVNASVALKWHLTHEPFALQALDLLNDWRKGDLDLLAPDIFFAEISHALVRAIRRGRLSPDEAKTVLSDLLAVAVQMFPIRLLVQRAMEIALQHQQSAYDCLYAALAEREGVELWTGDERLVNALIAHFLFVRFIGDYAPKRNV